MLICCYFQVLIICLPSNVTGQCETCFESFVECTSSTDCDSWQDTSIRGLASLIIRRCVVNKCPTVSCPVPELCRSCPEPIETTGIESVASSGSEVQECQDKLEKCGQKVLTMKDDFDFENTSKLGSQKLHSDCLNELQTIKDSVRGFRQQLEGCRQKMESRVDLAGDLEECEQEVVTLRLQNNLTDVCQSDLDDMIKKNQNCELALGIFEESNQEIGSKNGFLLNQVSNLTSKLDVTVRELNRVERNHRDCGARRETEVRQLSECREQLRLSTDSLGEFDSAITGTLS